MSDPAPTFMPQITAQGRCSRIALVALFALGQALFAGMAAFATRDVFLALREFAIVPNGALLALALSGVGIAVMRVGERVTAEKVGQSYAADLRKELFNHLTQVPARAIQTKRNGALALRFVGDLSAVRNWVALGLSRLISASIILPLATLVLFLLDPMLGLAASVPILLGIAAMAVIGARLAPLYRTLRSRRARLAADMSERIPVAAELRLLGRMGLENDNLEKRTARMVEAAVQRVYSSSALRAIPDIASSLAAAALLYAALIGGIKPALVAGALAALGLMVQPMRSLAGVWDKHRNWLVAREKCERLLAIPRHAQEEQGRIVELVQRPVVEFRNAASGRLDEINASLTSGRKVGIIGCNGAGKSTLLHLAAGLDKPEAGAVLIGGKAPNALTVEERTEMLALMSKASPILAGSVRRALTMGLNPRPKDRAILAAAEKFGLGQVIERLGGLNGKVAEMGRNLSSGEIRRLLLARLSLGDARVLLLDEPDDALDARGEDLVMELIDRPGSSAMVITHSLHLARQMDEIWVIEDGRLTAKAPPEELLAPHSHWAMRMGEKEAA